MVFKIFLVIQKSEYNKKNYGRYLFFMTTSWLNEQSQNFRYSILRHVQINHLLARHENSLLKQNTCEYLVNALKKLSHAIITSWAHYRWLTDYQWWRFRAVGSDVGQINEVTLRRARLGWVGVRVQLLVREIYLSLTNHTGQLSLAIPPWVGAMSTGQRAVMLCDWE